MTLILDRAAQALNTKKHLLIIFCDLKKAFDTCNKNILLKKLFNMGIQGLEHEWFNSYLSGRGQFVCIDGTFSYIHEINLGVPQGSIWAPYFLKFMSTTCLQPVYFYLSCLLTIQRL